MRPAVASTWMLLTSLAAAGAIPETGALAGGPILPTTPIGPVQPRRPTFPVGHLITLNEIPSGSIVDTLWSPTVAFSVVTGMSADGSSGSTAPVAGQHVYSVSDPTLPACPPPGRPMIPPASLPAIPAPCGNAFGTYSNSFLLGAGFQNTNAPWSIQATFAPSKQSVAIDVRPGLPNSWPPSTSTWNNLGPTPNEPYLTAFESNGTVVGQALYGNRGNQWGQFATLTISAPPGKSIAYVVFGTQNLNKSNPTCPSCNLITAEFEGLAFY